MKHFIVMGEARLDSTAWESGIYFDSNRLREAEGL